jgi:hypothetical protein
MKIFRRTLFFAFALGLLCTPWLVSPPPPLYERFLAIYAVGSLLGMVAWAAIFLKTEPMLTRIGLWLVFASFSFALFLQVVTDL